MLNTLLLLIGIIVILVTLGAMLYAMFTYI
jgi:hypothetical protein